MINQPRGPLCGRVDEEEQTLPSSCADIDVASDSLRAGCRDWTVTKNHSYYIPQVEDYMVSQITGLE